MPICTAYYLSATVHICISVGVFKVVQCAITYLVPLHT